MRTLNALERLHADYAAHAQRAPAALTRDRRRSLLFYWGEISLLARTPISPQIPDLVIQWLRTLAELEAFIARENRWPRENRRLPRAAVTAEERRLTIWVRTQRIAIARGARCEYQVRRLASIPGFRLHPLGDQWVRNCIDYQHFTSAHQRAPRLRSDDPTERRLAAFAAKQRLAFRQGTQDPSRTASLERLKFWTWGSALPKP